MGPTSEFSVMALLFFAEHPTKSLRESFVS
jgi:hypothetical protein